MCDRFVLLPVSSDRVEENPRVIVQVRGRIRIRHARGVGFFLVKESLQHSGNRWSDKAHIRDPGRDFHGLISGKHGSERISSRPKRLIGGNSCRPESRCTPPADGAEESAFRAVAGRIVGLGIAEEWTPCDCSCSILRRAVEDPR